MMISASKIKSLILARKSITIDLKKQAMKLFLRNIAQDFTNQYLQYLQNKRLSLADKVV
jgi:hypothetical protein